MASRLKQITVLGPGGVGGCLAVMLASIGSAVTVVARDVARTPTSFRMVSERWGEISARLETTSVLKDRTDVLFVTTKAYQLEAALARIPPGTVEAALVVPLMNGIEHLDVLRSRFGHSVVPATIGAIEALALQPGQIEHRSREAPVISVASNIPSADAIDELRELLTLADFIVHAHPSEADAMWGKLVRLAPIATTTAAARRPLGFVLEDRAWREKLEACVVESVAVAQMEGHDTSASAVMGTIQSLPHGLTTSMQRDIADGRPSELEAISGAVLRRGQRQGLSCPMLEGLYLHLRRVSGERVDEAT